MVKALVVTVGEGKDSGGDKLPEDMLEVTITKVLPNGKGLDLGKSGFSVPGKDPVYLDDADRVHWPLAHVRASRENITKAAAAQEQAAKNDGDMENEADDNSGNGDLVDPSEAKPQPPEEESDAGGLGLAADD